MSKNIKFTWDGIEVDGDSWAVKIIGFLSGAIVVAIWFLFWFAYAHAVGVL